MSTGKLDGFLIDCHSPSEATLEVEIDCSHLTWSEYRELIIELEDLLSDIDERYAVKSLLVKGRGLKARYSRVTADKRTRKMRFSPFPSSYRNILTNTRAYMYNLVSQHCLVLESVGARKVYFLPKQVAPAFVEAVEALNESVIEPLKRDIEEFRQGQDYFAIEQCLHKHKVNHDVLRRTVFNVRKFVVDVIPVNFGYSVDADAVYAKMSRDKARRGLEILKGQIERKYREYSLSAAKDLAEKLMAMAETFDKSRKLRYFKAKLDKLIELCESLEMKDLVEQLLKPVRQICEAPRPKRATMVMERFGTQSLREAVGKYIGLL